MLRLGLARRGDYGRDDVACRVSSSAGETPTASRANCGNAHRAVGVVRFAVGIRQYAWPSFDALWFHGTGMGLLLAGALTALAASTPCLARAQSGGNRGERSRPGPRPRIR